MSWEGGVDLVAFSQDGVPMPNVIVHFARMVHTPIGSAPSGMILLPRADSPEPALMGFVSEDEAVAGCFGPKIFAGTPFENAPALRGQIEVEVNYPSFARVRISVNGYEIVSELQNLGDIEAVDRQSSALPFRDRSLEAAAEKAVLRVNGEERSIILPPVGMSGGAPAVFSPTGIYFR
jgi:hypothetical protein